MRLSRAFTMFTNLTIKKIPASTRIYERALSKLIPTFFYGARVGASVEKSVIFAVTGNLTAHEQLKE
jgi:hypothetical protein